MENLREEFELQIDQNYNEIILESDNKSYIKWLEKKVNKYKAKADKWDKLDEKIATYYPETTDDTEDHEYDDGLLGIGEAAAQAFGYL